jgi:hypothetical protein
MTLGLLLALAFAEDMDESTLNIHGHDLVSTSPDNIAQLSLVVDMMEWQLIH